MSEENSGQPEEKAAEEKPAEFKPITSQEELNKLIGERINSVKAKFADYDDLKTKAQKLAEIEESKKSELEKVTERIAATERERDAAKAEALRFRIANEYKLSQEDAMALEHVASEEGMRTVADRLRASAEAGRKPTPKPTSLKSGSSGEPPRGETGRAAAALRQLRQG